MSLNKKDYSVFGNSVICFSRKDKKKDKPIELVSKLKLDPQRVRKIMSPEETAALALNMKAFGQIEPLIIDQNNEVVHGTRRLEGL